MSFSTYCYWAWSISVQSTIFAAKEWLKLVSGRVTDWIALNNFDSALPRTAIASDFSCRTEIPRDTKWMVNTIQFMTTDNVRYLSCNHSSMKSLFTISHHTRSFRMS